jgi:hypothetical protein
MIKGHVCQLGEQKAYRIIKQPMWELNIGDTGNNLFSRLSLKGEEILLRGVSEKPSSDSAYFAIKLKRGEVKRYFWVNNSNPWACPGSLYSGLLGS